METNRSTLAVIALGLAVALGACGIGSGAGDDTTTIDTSTVHTPPGGSSASCYHDWTAFFQKQQDGFTVPQGGVLSGPGATQDVPLYHDCQRFESSATQYGAFFAIFATQRIRNLPPLTEQTAIPVVQIFAWDGYQPLNITRGFNCVYMYMSGTSRVARIVGSGSTEGNCLALKQVDATLLTAPLLEVKFVSSPTGLSLTDIDVPPVARWDRDPNNGQYYFGVKCGAAWCEVGAPGFASSLSPLEVLNATPGAAPLNAGLQRRYSVKGWYDEQYLSVMNGNTVIPSRIKGTVIPDVGLTTTDTTIFDNAWVPVVRVLLDTTQQGNNPYQEKLNLGHTQPGEYNEVALCHRINDCPGMPTPPTCTSQSYQSEAILSGIPQNWIAKITRVDGVVAFRCVMARPTPTTITSAVPRSVRWHFLDNDEIVWQWCPSGCCEEWSEG